MKLRKKEFKDSVYMLVCMFLAIWFCIAALWKTAEVVSVGVRNINIKAYYRIMDNMDNAVLRFWRIDVADTTNDKVS